MWKIDEDWNEAVEVKKKNKNNASLEHDKCPIA